MIKDKALEELFLAQKPRFTDSDRFMASLTKRLDAVEFIKQQQDATIRRYKLFMVAAFVVGIISGVVTIAYILSTPAEVPIFTFLEKQSVFVNSRLMSKFLLWLAENSRIITATALSLLMTLGIISIISNVQDIMRMRAFAIDKK